MATFNSIRAELDQCQLLRRFQAYDASRKILYSSLLVPDRGRKAPTLASIRITRLNPSRTFSVRHIRPPAPRFG